MQKIKNQNRFKLLNSNTEIWKTMEKCLQIFEGKLFPSDILDSVKLSIKWEDQTKTLSLKQSCKDLPSVHSFSGNYERMYFIKIKG